MYKTNNPKVELIVKISFFLLVFFTFFPTGLPFQARLQEQGAEEIGQSNLINQFIRITIFLLSLWGAIYKPREILNFIFEEKFIILFLLWALITISWSSYPLVSLKRWFQIFIFYFSTIVYLNYFQDIDQPLKIITPIVFLYLILTISVILAVPAAKDPLFHTWRGFSPHKNHLGQLALLSILTLNIARCREKNNYKKYIIILFLFLAIVILFGAYSSTSILAFLLFMAFTLVFYLIEQLRNILNFNSTINLLFIIFSIALILSIYFGFLDKIDELGLFGKDFTTLSDRTYLWDYMLLEISKHPILGTGFRGFWVVESPKIIALWQIFPFLPIQSHNGYLDLINETGIIGILLLILLVSSFYVRTYKGKNSWKWSWFITLTLFINISESTLFKEGHSTFIFFVIAYLINFNIYKQNRKSIQ